MKELVYKFLDDYLGDKFYSEPNYRFNVDFIKSCKNDKQVFYVEYYKLCKEFVMVEDQWVGELISAFFCIDYREARQYFVDWFENRNKIKFKNAGRVLKYLKSIRITENERIDI